MLETDEAKVITFLKYKKEYESPSPARFGNQEGINIHAGDDIAVVGTPNVNDLVYKLIGTSLGVDCNKQNMKLVETKTKYHKFWLTSFEEQTLQNIQRWFLKSELEQAVGRARLLRNDCTVYVFSSYPIAQAEFRSFREKRDGKKTLSDGGQTEWKGVFIY